MSKKMKYEQDWLSGTLDRDSECGSLFDPYDDDAGEALPEVELEPWHKGDMNRYVRERLREMDLQASETAVGDLGFEDGE